MDHAPLAREGQLLAGKYRIEARLGGGGMAEVYRAQHEMIGRAVAIKLLRREQAQHPEVVLRFIREARAANIVRHPNVVDVLDIGVDEQGVPFIVQELLEGQDLRQYLHALGGRASVERTLALLGPVVDAVAMAHGRGVVHRDLKPENVFLARAPGGVVPKVLDFGISKILEETGEGVTLTGRPIGTPAYMSPEQIRRASTVDACTDVWALGVMLYEMLAGQLPFEAPTQGGLFVKICLEDPPSLVERAPGLPLGLADIVLRCLARRPEDRYPTAAALAEALRPLLPPRSARSSGRIVPVDVPAEAPHDLGVEIHDTSVENTAELTTSAILADDASAPAAPAPLLPPTVPPAAVPSPGSSGVVRAAVAPSRASAVPAPPVLRSDVPPTPPERRVEPAEPDEGAPHLTTGPDTRKLGNRGALPSVDVPRYLRATLRVVLGKSAGRVFRLEKAMTLVGRSPGADVLLSDDGVSREHFVVSYHHGSREFRVNDMGSSNGTLLNGSEVRSYALRSGDTLVAGTTTLIFEVETVPG